MLINHKWLLILVCLSTTLNAQLSIENWNMDEIPNKILSSKTTPFFEEMPLHYRTATIDVAEIFMKMTNERHRIDLPNSSGEFSAYEIWPVDVVPKDMINPRSAKTFRGYRAADPNVKVSFTIFDKALYAAVYEDSGIEFISPASYDNNIYVLYNGRDENHPYVMCGVEDEHVVRGENNPHKHRTDNLRTLRVAYTASGEYAQQFGGNPYDAQVVLNSITAGINLINPILERDLNLNLINVTTTAITYPDPNTDPYTDLNDHNQLLAQSQSSIDANIGNSNYDIGHLIFWHNIGGLAYVGVACNNSYKAQAYSGITNSFDVLWIDYVAHEMGHQLGMRHNHSTVPSCNTTDDYRFEPGDGSSIMSYAGLCGNSYQNYAEPYYHISSINKYNNYSFNCAVDGNSVAAPTVAADMNTITIPKSTPFVLVGSGSASLYNWNQYDGSGPGESSSPSGTCTDCANFKYAIPTTETYRHFPDLAFSIVNGGNDVIWEKLSSVERTMNFKLVGRNNPGIGSDDVVVNISENGPLEVSYPNGGEQLNGNSTITTTWNVNGTQNESATVDIFISTNGGTTFDLLVGDTPNDGSESINLPNITSAISYILIQGHVDSETFRGGSTFYDLSDNAFGIGESPITPPTNDDFSEAVQGYFGDVLPGDLEFATVESYPPLSCSSVMISKDVWFMYEIGNPYAGEEFRVILNFDNPGNYGLELTIPEINYSICQSLSTYANIGVILQTDLTAGSLAFVRVYKKSFGAHDRGLDTRVPETFTISSQGSSVLPIKLESFSGVRKGRYTELSWTTLSERNTSHFVLLGSSNGQDWDQVKEKAAYGNSDSRRSYSIRDDNTENKYYRLKSVDLDGAMDYSEVIFISDESVSSSIAVYPNPADQELHIVLPSKNKHDGILMITDQQGKQIMSFDLSTSDKNKLDLDISNQKPGIYFLSYFGETTWNQKIIIL